MRDGLDHSAARDTEGGKRIKEALETEAFPLAEADACQLVQVVQTTGGRNHRAKLATMGVMPGSELKVCCNLGGPLIIEVKGSRLSLGRGMARKILVLSIGDAKPCECHGEPVCPEGKDRKKPKNG